MISAAVVKKAVGLMSLAKFFPGDEDSRAALMETLGQMCASDEEVLWLARRVSDSCEEWPGIQALWQMRFTKRGPANDREKKIDKASSSTIGLPGISRPELTSGDGEKVKMLPLPEGHAVSMDPEAEKAILDLSVARAMPPVKRFRTISNDEARVDATLRNMYGLKEGE